MSSACQILVQSVKNETLNEAASLVIECRQASPRQSTGFGGSPDITWSLYQGDDIVANYIILDQPRNVEFSTEFNETIATVDIDGVRLHGIGRDEISAEVDLRSIFRCHRSLLRSTGTLEQWINDQATVAC